MLGLLRSNSRHADGGCLSVLSRQGSSNPLYPLPIRTRLTYRQPSAPRTFVDGLEKELGGPRAPRAAVTPYDDAAFIEGGSRSSRDGPKLNEALEH